MKKYIRFGEIPENEKSGIYAIDEGKIGEEIGVSCYECIQDENGYFHAIMPAKITFDTGVSYQWAFDGWMSGKYNTYIITGDEIGYGSDNEPLLRNIQILEKLDREKYKDL